MYIITCTLSIKIFYITIFVDKIILVTVCFNFHLYTCLFPYLNSLQTETVTLSIAL